MKNPEKIIKIITENIKKETGIATIGLSGGADSTLVSTLCMLALGKENVYGIGMPYNNFDYNTFNSRSKKLAETLGINYEEVSIAGAVGEVSNSIDDITDGMISSLNFGNIKSRMRMIYLYTYNQVIAEKTEKRCRVIGTGNLSEDFIGYDTKGGDALADFFPIGELFKSEVYQLLDYFVEKGILTEDLIDRVPSAGLEDGQTDEKDLGYTYNEMEPVIKKFMYGDGFFVEAPETTEIEKFVWNRHIQNKHKHEAPKVFSLRHLID